MRTPTRRWTLALLVAVAVAACADADDLPETAPDDAVEDEAAEVEEDATEEPGDPEAVEEAELVTLDRIGAPDAPNSFTFQVTQGHSHQSTTAPWAAGITDLYQEWAEANPDWRIEIDVIPGAEVTQNMAVLLEEARVGRAPDCAEVDSFVIAQFIEQGHLQPITEHFDEEELDGFYPFVSDVVIQDGELYAFWWNTDLRVLYHRTDLIPEAPTSWDELIEVAQQATEQEPGVDGYLFNGGRWEATTFDHLAYFWSQGGELVDEDGRPVFGEGENREYMLNVLDLLAEAVESGASPERVATITEYEEFNTAAQNGQVASFLGGHWQYGQLEESLDPEQFELWDFAMPPTRDPGDEPVTGTGGWTFAAFTEDPEIATMCMDFVKSIYQGPANALTGQLPTSPDLLEELDEFDEPQFQEFNEFLELGRARPGVPVYPQISEQLQVGVGQVLTGEATAEEVLDRAFERSIQAYGEN
jgi:multiple sugar transport system substrate-binding protein